MFILKLPNRKWQELSMSLKHFGIRAIVTFHGILPFEQKSHSRTHTFIHIAPAAVFFAAFDKWG